MSAIFRPVTMVQRKIKFQQRSTLLSKLIHHHCTQLSKASMAGKRRSEKEKKERLREQKRTWIRKKREKMTEAEIEKRRQNDRERYRKKKEAGEIKSIKEYSPRMQKAIRKSWRERAKTHRNKLKRLKATEQRIVNDETPPPSPTSHSSTISIRASLGRRLAERNKRRLKIENMHLKQRILHLENLLANKRMQLLRTRQPRNVRVTTDEPPETILTGRKRKQIEKKEAVRKFLEKDECSRITSGKKETITKNKQKKQIRLLNDTMLNLYEKFKEESKIKMSYALFCRLRPFWVLVPNANKRNTCLCVIHTNMEMMVTALKKAAIIKENSAISLVKSMCCEGNLRSDCLARQCNLCKSKSINLNKYPNDMLITCERWITKKITTTIKGQVKICQKTVKESFSSKSKVFVKTFLEDKLPKFIKHLLNIISQHKVLTKLKNELADDEALLHMDFSENYNCKYSAEVQSAHFGSSKPQISLHTSVLYLRGRDKNSIQSFCSLSKNLRHDPVLICAHLKPIIEHIQYKVPNLRTMHFQSDGPSSQYRNKSMFFLIAKYLSKELGADNIIWHFSETGHGKGAPDGIGGCVKRTADAFVATGGDIPDFEALVNCLQEKCKGIIILPIDDTHVDNISKILSTSTTRPFTGTLSIHQLTWNKANPDILHARRLSCSVCKTNQICSHHEIGLIYVTYKQQQTIYDNIPVLRTSAHSRSESPQSEYEYKNPIATTSRTSIDFYRKCYGSDSSSDEDIFETRKQTPLRENVKNTKSSDLNLQSLSNNKSSDEENIF